MSEEDRHECGCGDEVIMGPEISGGSRIAMRHTADHRIAPCVIRPIGDGRPLMGADLVALERIDGDRYGVKTVYCGRKGPARVTTEAYRDGWDRVFKKDDQVN